MDKIKFPDNFLWGAATSSHQVEGNNRNNDWWKWEEAKKVKEPSGIACDQYNLYKEDFRIAKDLGHNTHRFSLEWSRIEPEEGKFDAGALNHYRDMIKTLRSMGMEPIVTLNHFTLPVWVSEKGGWLYENIERAFEVFCEKTVSALGEEVTYWVTLNEPVGHAYTSYVDGSWPPGHHSFKDATKVFVKMLLAHSLAYRAIHKVYMEKGWPRPKVSITKHVLLFSPCRKTSILDLLAAKLRYYYFSRLFVVSIMRGWCLAPGIPFVKLPVKRSLDYIGVNYYLIDRIRSMGLLPPKVFGYVCTYEHHLHEVKRNYLKWEIFPDGLYKVLMEYSRFGLPLFVMENGTCTDDDKDRVDFIKSHVGAVARAMKDGAPVIGYLYWSLLDNFEWAHGYGPRFGIIEVDRDTRKRTIKPSAMIFSEIIKNNAI